MKDVAYGLVAGALGAVVWAAVVYVTKYEVGWIAWGIGAGVGYAVAVGNQDRHRSATAAGALAVGITVLSIVAGKYAAVQSLLPSDEEIVAMFTQDFENEEFVISYVADAVSGEFAEAGMDLAWPEGVDPSNASSRTDYPSEVWAEAEARWAAWTEAEQAAFREGREGEVRANVEASLPDIRAAFSTGGFAGSFSPMDIIFFGLAMVTAWGVGSGKKSKERIQSEFQRAVKLAMLRVMLADGDIDDEEVAVVAELYRQVTGEEITPEAVRADAAVVQSGEGGLNATLTELGPHLTDQGRGMVVRAALMVALADGTFSPEEQRLVHGIARALGLDDDAFNAVLADVVERARDVEAQEDGEVEDHA